MDFDPENYEDKTLLEMLDNLAEHDNMRLMEASIIDELINRENLKDYE